MNMTNRGKRRDAALYCFLAALFVTALGCGQKRDNPYVFVREKNGVSVYLDSAGGKLIYVNEANTVIDYVSLKPGFKERKALAENKKQVLRNVDRGTDTLHGTNYSISLSTRFYNNRLLYVLELVPNDDMALDVASTVEITLMDESGFNIGGITPISQWTEAISIDETGETAHLVNQGSIPFTLSDYLEFETWAPTWVDLMGSFAE